MRSSLIIPCNLAISRGHRNAAQTAPSGVRSAIPEKNKSEELKKRAETQENVKIHFQAPPPHASSKISQSTNFPINFLIMLHQFSSRTPEPNFSKNFVQRRWVYSVVETTSYVKKKKSETYRKEFRSQTDKTKRRNIFKKESHLLHKEATDDKTRSLCLIHLLSN